MNDRPNVFAGLALERNAEQRDDAEWAAARLADPGARFLLLGADDGHGRSALVQAAADALRWLSQDERRALAPDLVPTYLGDDGFGALFALSADGERAERLRAALGGHWLDLRSAGARLPAFQSGLFAYARALAHWQGRTRFCGACGAPLARGALGHRLQCTNPACALEHFPRVDPAMIVIVTWQDRCLLGRQPSWAPNRYSTLAGFIEPGESLEDAVRREVLEEAGVRVGPCSYHSSQPWPFPSSLMLGFTAEAEDPTIRVGRELSDARWFGVDELVDGLGSGRLSLPPRLSVSHALIAHWLRQSAGLDLAELLAR
ncbi:MAG: NAD(+) diphosphatase [Rhodanobacteraceae bacterium]|jgi:NAD+ diphosphatase|nr:NAD(+) diphosphatase [Rhodanobacteraceae bacterium]